MADSKDDKGDEPAAKPKLSAKKAPSEPPRAFCQHKTGVVDFTAPEGGATEGRFYRIGDMVAFAAVSAPEGQPFRAIIAGLFNDAPGVASGDFAEGTALAFDGKAFVKADGRAVAFVGRGGKSLHLTGQAG